MGFRVIVMVMRGFGEVSRGVGVATLAYFAAHFRLTVERCSG
jgi:hypothetical protein